MVVILAVVGIIFLLCIRGNQKAGHAGYSCSQNLRSQWKDKYVDDESLSSPIKSRILNLDYEGKKEMAEYFKSLFSTFPNNDKYVDKIDANTKFTLPFYYEMLCAADGKVSGSLYLNKSAPRNNVPLSLEYDFVFEEARLDWIASELKRHGVNTPLFARLKSHAETRTVDWKGKPHYSGNFFVPYKERPFDMPCELVWNIEGKPPIYPR